MYVGVVHVVYMCVGVCYVCRRPMCVSPCVIDCLRCMQYAHIEMDLSYIFLHMLGQQTHNIYLDQTAGYCHKKFNMI